MADFAKWIKEFFADFLAWLWSLYLSYLEWITDWMMWAGQKLYEMLLAGLASLLESLPVPTFMQNAGSYWDAMPPSVVWGLHFFAVGEGLAMVSGALVLRFIIRRIPFIG